VTLLGSYGFSQYKQYQKDLTEHLAVAQLSDQLTQSGVTPLTQQQRADLFFLVKQDSATSKPMLIAERQKRIAQSVETILTSEQLAQYHRANVKRSRQSSQPTGSDT
jgi:hypothetical protein